MGVLARRGKLAALQRGRAQVHTLWRTGLLPAAAHGAGASGVVPATLAKLRTLAGSLVGAKSHASLTAWLATQSDE
eukprot:8445358-Pyramimonas_sp.AAC.1